MAFFVSSQWMLSAHVTVIRYSDSVNLLNQAVLDLVPKTYKSIRQDADKLGAHIYKLIRSLD